MLSFMVGKALHPRSDIFVDVYFSEILVPTAQRL